MRHILTALIFAFVVLSLGLMHQSVTTREYPSELWQFVMILLNTFMNLILFRGRFK